MNILIKLTSIVSLIIAPYIAVGGNSTNTAEGDCCKDKKEMVASTCDHDAESTCNMDECKDMTLAECMKKCDEKGCSDEERAKCASMYDEDGKYVGTPKKDCCKDKK